MWGKTRYARWVAVAAFVCAMTAIRAEAQRTEIAVGLLTDLNVGCVLTSITTGCSEGGVECPPDETCRSFGEASACVPNGALLCCFETGCPGDLECMKLITDPARPDLESGAVCLGPEGQTCAPAPATGAEPGGVSAACFIPPLAPATTPLVPWGQGDCDRDGLPNRTEESNAEAAGVEASDFVCIPPPARGLLRSGSSGLRCARINDACRPGGTCTLIAEGPEGICHPDASGNGTRCFADGAELPHPGLNYCEDEAAELFCVEGEDLVEIARLGFLLCVPRICLEALPLACITAPASTTSGFVPWNEGDCDADGTPNDDDEDPCSAAEIDGGTGETDAGSGETDAGSGETDAGSGETDAGSGETDAGSGETDAGSGETDAGSSETDAGRGLVAGMDGGVPPDETSLRFDGGGGALCSVHRSGAATVPLAVVWILALLLGRRRR